MLIWKTNIATTTSLVLMILLSFVLSLANVEFVTSIWYVVALVTAMYALAITIGRKLKIYCHEDFAWPFLLLHATNCGILAAATNFITKDVDPLIPRAVIGLLVMVILVNPWVVTFGNRADRLPWVVAFYTTLPIGIGVAFGSLFFLWQKRHSEKKRA